MDKKSSIEISTYKDLLKHNHYSSAFILYLLAKLETITSVTFQEINEIIQNQSSLLIQYFAQNPDELHLLENKNPLCLETIRDFMNKVFRGVYKKYGRNVNQFKQGLKEACQNLIKIIITSTQQVADIAYMFLLEKNYTHILVYNYSKSIAITLKKLSKFLGSNIEVTVCQCGNTPQGKKFFQELSIENVNCRLINDTEIAYYVREVDCILTGAEVVLENGSILNRVGTQILAHCAQQTHKPLIVMSQSYKFLKRTYLTQQDIPNFYRQEEREKSILVDLVDRKYINFLCTDIGLMGPEAVTYKMASIINS